jgi:hypothetical protein
MLARNLESPVSLLRLLSGRVSVPGNGGAGVGGSGGAGAGSFTAVEGICVDVTTSCLIGIELFVEGWLLF